MTTKTYGDVLNLAIEKSKGIIDVFVEYSAHVQEIGIRIYITGFEAKAKYQVFRKYLEDTSPEECYTFILDTFNNDDAEEHN
jgi:hypothetical protein